MTERKKQEPMTNEKWNEIEGKWKNWIKDNPDWDEKYDGLMSVPSLLKRGKAKADKRRRIATGIRTCFIAEEVPDNPFSAGATSSLPEKVERTKTSEMAELKKAYAQFWKTCVQARRYLVKSKRGGGGVFSSADDYAEYQIGLLTNKLSAYYNDFADGKTTKDYHWKGTETALVNNIPALKAAADAKKAEQEESSTEDE
jgi:hypothetical protein